MADRIDYDSSGNLDDVVVENVNTFRLEFMDDNTVWLACYRGVEHGGDVVFWLSSSGAISGKVGED
jgi:hypothetical protein